MMESWALIPGYEGRYRVSDEGRVQTSSAPGGKSRGEWRDLSQPRDKFNYPLVYLWSRTTGRVRCHVHRLVAEAFVPNPENKRCVNHLDGNRGGNSARNLEWCTHAENIEHAYRTGLCRQKLTPDQVREIRSCGGLDTAAAQRFNVSQVLVTKIRARKVWKHIL